MDNMVGIIILNYQTWRLSERCIKSIFQTCFIPFRIYLVDNASTNPMPAGLQEYISCHPDEICLLQATKNGGYAAGMNIGIKKALEEGCDVIVLSNNDIVFCQNAIDNMVECLEKHREVGIVGPKVMDERGRLQDSRCYMKTGMLEIFQIYTVAKFVFRKKWKRYFGLDKNAERPDYVYHVSGCCFAMSGACAGKVTPLDEGTLLYHEELILGILMERAGFRTMYEPGSVVLHRHGATTQKALPFMYQCRSQSELYYCSKYLGAKKWQLWLLYQYRKAVYLARCINSKELRKGWDTYRSEVKKQLYN